MSTLAPTTEEPILNNDHLEVLTSLSEDEPKALVQDLYDTFQGDYPNVFQTIEDAVKTQDMDALRKGIHKLNGSAANLGFNRLSLYCRDAEGQIIDHKFTSFDTVCATITDLYNESVKQFEEFLASI